VPTDEPAPQRQNSLRLRQVGVVRSPITEPSLVARSGDLSWRARAARAAQAEDTVAQIVIDASLGGILAGIEEFSHLLVLYWAHRVAPQGRSMTQAHPMGRKNLPLVGIFATCSPARPNPICASVARLLEHSDNVLTVRGLDAVDGSPVLDIKPYNPSYYSVPDAAVAGWMEQIYRDIANGLNASPDTEEERS